MSSPSSTGADARPAPRTGRPSPDRRAWPTVAVVVLVLLAVLASLIMVVTSSAVWTKIAIAAALWAAVLGALVMMHYQRRANQLSSSAGLLADDYQRQLQREIDKYDEQEAARRAEIEEAAREEMTQLRTELTALRFQLSQMFGPEFDEQLAIGDGSGEFYYPYDEAGNYITPSYYMEDYDEEAYPYPEEGMVGVPMGPVDDNVADAEVVTESRDAEPLFSVHTVSDMHEQQREKERRERELRENERREQERRKREEREARERREREARERREREERERLEQERREREMRQQKERQEARRQQQRKAEEQAAREFAERERREREAREQERRQREEREARHREEEERGRSYREAAAAESRPRRLRGEDNPQATSVASLLSARNAGGTAPAGGRRHSSQSPSAPESAAPQRSHHRRRTTDGWPNFSQGFSSLEEPQFDWDDLSSPTEKSSGAHTPAHSARHSEGERSTEGHARRAAESSASGGRRARGDGDVSFSDLVKRLGKE